LKRLLKKIWKLQFLGGKAPEEDLLKEGLGGALRRAIEEGLVEPFQGGYRLTGKGREGLKVVLCGGVFDLLHPGHVFFLERAKGEGDLLVVVVARDTTVREKKRVPIIPESQRREMVEHLKPVDLAILGHEEDPLETVEAVRPDVIALGPDQRHDADALLRELGERGLPVRIVKIEEFRESPLSRSGAILRKIREG
jgi:FAD synthetase